MDNNDERKSAGNLAHDFLAKGDPTGWFEPLYAAADAHGNGVPWAKMAANPHLAAWLQENKIDGGGKSALVVGCGLGDDAEALAGRGFAVTAFDIAASAIALCRQRFRDSAVNYQVADLFAVPDEWPGAFDLVFESITVQALPPELQERAIEQIARFVAPGGCILVITSARHPDHVPGGPPWPLSRDSLKRYEDAGLREEFLEAEVIQTQPVFWHIRALYAREA